MAVASAIILSGCAPSQQKRITWNRDCNESIAHFHKPVVQPSSINYPLHELDRGLLFFKNGDFLHSDSRYANAMRSIDQIRGKGEVGAVVWDERAKSFKGEPYERATAYFYRGLGRFNQGDYSGALAAFRSSLAADAETRNKERKYLEDFAVSHYMAALCYDRLGERENARVALEMAKAALPENPNVSQLRLDANFVAVLGVGFGPFKRGARDYATGKSPEYVVEVAIGTQEPTIACETTDLLAQAKSQRWGEADTARVTRVVGKAILSGVIQGLTGVDPNIREDPDVRSWHGLPLKFYVLTATVPAGNHKVTVKCFDAKRHEVQRDRQTWFDVPIRAAKGPVLYLTVQQNWQNHHGLEQVTIDANARRADQ